MLFRSGSHTPRYPSVNFDVEMKGLQDAYQSLKNRLLRTGTEGRIPVRRMVEELDTLSNIRRLAEQADKAARYLQSLQDYLDQAPKSQPDSAADSDATP